MCTHIKFDEIRRFDSITDYNKKLPDLNVSDTTFMWCLDPEIRGVTTFNVRVVTKHHGDDIPDSGETKLSSMYYELAPIDPDFEGKLYRVDYFVVDGQFMSMARVNTAENLDKFVPCYCVMETPEPSVELTILLYCSITEIEYIGIIELYRVLMYTNMLMITGRVDESNKLVLNEMSGAVLVLGLSSICVSKLKPVSGETEQERELSFLEQANNLFECWDLNQLRGLYSNHGVFPDFIDFYESMI